MEEYFIEAYNEEEEEGEPYKEFNEYDEGGYWDDREEE